MAIRNIIEIDEEKCNGCGECVSACAEGAIKMIDGKAKLVSDVYCDGLGACLGDCPVDALKVIQRDADEFDEEAVNDHLATIGRPPLKDESPAPAACPSTAPQAMGHGGGCPGSMARSMTTSVTADTGDDRPSHLANWPLQLHLVSPMAPYFKNAHLKVVADCVPFALNGFHERLLKGDPVVIACPKLDETGSYVDKLAQIIAENELTAVTVAHMEVPCCTGIRMMVEKARQLSGIDVIVHDVVVSISGEIISEREI
jgi:NAD-dependent dihydropyrimidine dehydrogenase PreA subunit